MSSRDGTTPEEARIAELLRRGLECVRDARHGEAEECFRQILSLQPEHSGARGHLGHLLAVQAYACQERGEIESAIERYEESLALDQSRARAHNNLGNVYKNVGRFEDAAAAYREAIAQDPGLAEAHFNLANLLYQLTGETAQAIAHCRSALDLNPSLADASLNLGFFLEQEGDARGATQCYRDAIAAAPELAEAHFNYALQLLLRGDLGTGWQEYEWRMRRPDVQASLPHAGAVRWDGAALDGKVILLYGEQGFGDVIQFARYASLVAERGGKVIVSAHAKLNALLRSVPGVSEVLGNTEPPPAFDVCCSLLTLPRIFGTTLETIPAQVPYMRAETEKAMRWKSRLAADGASMRVGLYWATETRSRFAPLKSFALDKLAPLAAVPGVTYYSLQRGAAAGQAVHPPRGMKLVDLSAELADFSDDAALIANLDLVISIDTATAHLAGALGKPIWTLTHFPPEWRWLLGRDDSPWYPTMRLFRQGRAQPW
ncbi:MAG: tetratricopeptide repeat protein, partial [Burkholderiales bacterium]